MNKLMFLLAALSCSLWSAAQLEQIVVEPHTLSNPASIQPDGTTTYRVYAEMASPADLVSAVFAEDGCHPVDITTTTSFFNDEMGFITPSMISQGQYGVFPNIEADSWVTIGAENQESIGAPLVQWFPGPDPDVFMNSFGLPSDGASFNLTEGMWFVPENAPSGMPTGDNNRVLLGQFTTDGELSFNLNLRVYLQGDYENGRVDYVYEESCSGDGDPTGFEVVHPTLSYTPVFGCNNPNALNYDPSTNTDDGSCIVPDCAPTTPTTYEYCYGNGEQTEFYHTAATNDGDQVIIEITEGFVEEVFDKLRIYDGLGTSGEALFVGDGNLAGVIVTSTTGALTVRITSDGSISCQSPAFFESEIVYNVYCEDESIIGCTNPEAQNYDPEATFDDGTCFVCDDDAVDVSVTPGSWPEEISFDIFDSQGTLLASGDGGSADFQICGSPDCYLVEMYDSFGDGWNGGSVNFSINGESIGSINLNNAPYDQSGSYGRDYISINSDDVCPIEGCTDETAVNYNPDALENNGTCCYENLLTLSMSDTNGDGWNGATYQIFSADGSVVANGDLDSASDGDGLTLGSDDLCLPEGCYYIVVGGGCAEGELSWTLEGANEANLTGDVVSLNDYLTFTVGNATCVIGCTEPVACNYDPTANIAVCGACEYTSCQGCTYLGASNFNDQASIDNGSCLFEFENACPADINSDGTVNAGDLLEFLGAFGQTCS